MVYKYVFLSSLLGILFLTNTSISVINKLPLPANFTNKPIYYFHSIPLPGFACIYQVLFNACKLERSLGVNNRYFQPSLFIRRIMPYLKDKRINPKVGGTFVIPTALAPRLGLRHFYHLDLDRAGQLEIASSSPISISYNAGCSQSQIRQQVKEARKKQQAELLKKLQQEYARTPYGKVCCLHFECSYTIDGVGHVALISVVKAANGQKVICVFDNLNTPLYDNSPIAQYIRYLWSLF